MFNSIKTQKKVPTNWNKIIVSTFYKRKGSRRKLSNYRGVFLTLTVTKIFERVLYNRIYATLEISDFQGGARKGRGVHENLFMIRSAIDHFKHNKPLIFVMYDFKTCFDSIWLKDALVDIFFSGLKNEELLLLHELNKEAVMKIKTPFGLTEELILNMILKQGTVNGPILCCCTVGKFCDHCVQNNIAVNVHDIEIPPIAFVDDINGIADSISKSVVLNAHAEIFQKRKKLQFKVEKCKILPINTQTNSNELHQLMLNGEKVDVETEVTYLAEQFNQQGNNDALIKERVKSGRSSFSEIISLCELFMSYESKFITPSLMLLFNSIVVSRILVNCQTWTRLRKKDCESITICVQAGLKRILMTATSTPNCGVYLELGILPIEYVIKKRKMMFLHKILQNDKNNILYKIYEGQKHAHQHQKEKNWYSEIQDIKEEFQLRHTDEQIKELKKEEWKKKIKTTVTAVAVRKLLDEKQSKSKLRHITYENKTDLTRQNYFDIFPGKQAVLIFKTLL